MIDSQHIFISINGKIHLFKRVLRVNYAKSVSFCGLEPMPARPITIQSTDLSEWDKKSCLCQECKNLIFTSEVCDG
jgi:hypothetical protein